MPHTDFASSSIALRETSGKLSASDLLRRLAEMPRIWRRRVKERIALSELDARMLADIGISRADRDIECSKTFWQV